VPKKERKKERALDSIRIESIEFATEFLSLVPLQSQNQGREAIVLLVRSPLQGYEQLLSGLEKSLIDLKSYVVLLSALARLHRMDLGSSFHTTWNSFQCESPSQPGPLEAPCPSLEPEHMIAMRIEGDTHIWRFNV